MVQRTGYCDIKYTFFLSECQLLNLSKIKIFQGLRSSDVEEDCQKGLAMCTICVECKSLIASLKSDRNLQQILTVED